MNVGRTIKQTIQKNPLKVYFLAAFAIPWLPSFLVAGPRFFRGQDIELLSFMIGGAMFAAPILSGIIVTFFVDGKQGIRDLFKQMKIWRVGSWYLTLLIFPVLILIVSYLLSLLVSPDFTPGFVMGGIGMGIAAGFLEELGWTGFAFPRMREKHGESRASVYLGLIHVLWHFPLWFLWEYAALGLYWFPYFIAFSAVLVALRIIICRSFSETKSLLLAQLIHASSTGFLFVLTPLYTVPAHTAIFYAVYAAVLGGVALVPYKRLK